MTVRLFKFDAQINLIAVTKTAEFVADGLFFLDFNRKIKKLRWWGLDRWFGSTVALIVPVVHQSQPRGVFVIGVHRSDPHFSTIRALWKRRYESIETPLFSKTDGLKILADFGAQFPADCLPAKCRCDD